MSLAPLHLRLANIRRFLDKRTSDTNYALSHHDTAKFHKMIMDQKIPLIIINEGTNPKSFPYRVCVCESMKKSPGMFYRLDEGFKTEKSARSWIRKSFGFSCVWNDNPGMNG